MITDVNAILRRQESSRTIGFRYAGNTVRSTAVPSFTALHKHRCRYDHRLNKQHGCLARRRLRAALKLERKAGSPQGKTAATEIHSR